MTLPRFLRLCLFSPFLVVAACGDPEADPDDSTVPSDSDDSSDSTDPEPMDPDTTPPTVGDEITFDRIGTSRVRVNWGSASDDKSDGASLQYKLVRADSPEEIDSLAEIEAIEDGPELVQDYRADFLSKTVEELSADTTYAFAVVVRDEEGNRSIYAPAEVTTLEDVAPVVGDAIDFTDVTESGLTVSWGAATDNVTEPEDLEYKLVRATSVDAIDTVAEVEAIEEGPGLVQDFTTDFTSKSLSGLDSSTSYAFAVLVRDEAGNTALYEPRAVSTLDVTAPVLSGLISFSDLRADGVTVNWTAASDDVSAAADLRYKVVQAGDAADIDTIAEVDAIESGPGLVVDFTEALTSQVVNGLSSSSTYAFAVLVADEAGNQALYAPGVVSTLDISAPAVGQAISFTDVGDEEFTANWGAATDDVTPADQLQYKVVIASQAADIDTLEEVDAITSGASLVVDFTANLTSREIADLVSSSSYAVAVVVRDAAGNEALYSPATQSTDDVTAPVAGSGISFTNVGASTVTVNWGAGSDDLTIESGLAYKVVRASSSAEIDTLDEIDAITSGGGLVQDFTAASVSVSATGLTPLVTYWFAVVVRDEAGNRTLYAPADVTTVDGTPPTPGTGLSFSGVSTSGLTVNWGAGTDDITAQANLQYKVVRASLSGSIDTVEEANAITGPDLLVDWSTNTISTAVTGLAAGDYHFYAVLVRDGVGNMSLYGLRSRVAGPIFYVSTQKHSSNLGGPSGADALCGTLRDPNVATDVSPKAVLAAGNARRACTTANCTSAAENVDWPLHANTTYYNTSGGVVGTTNSAGIFSFPLTNAPSVGSTAYTHSGFNNNWTSNSGNCSDFTEDASTSVLYLGRPAQNSVGAIWYANTLCSYSVSVVPIYLLCVEP